MTHLISAFKIKPAVFGFILAISSTLANPTPAKDNSRQITNVMQNIMHKYAIPGAVVVTYKDGKAHQYTFGVQNKDTNIAVSNKTLFELGSVTKSFSGLILAKQLNSGTMELNDTLDKYLPDNITASPAINKLTLLELATHTSGLPDDAPKLPYNAPNSKQNSTILAKFLHNWVASYRGGTQTLYSNLGFSLLGLALADEENTPLTQVMQKEVLNPLNMQNSYLNITKAQYKVYAQGYTAAGTPARSPQAGLLAGSWAMKSCAQDMEQYLRAAIGLADTPDQIIKAMHTAQSAYFQPQQRDWQSGLGWTIIPLVNADKKELLKIPPLAPHKKIPLPVIKIEKPHYVAHALIEKTGATNGFRAYIGVIPDQKTGIVILVNRFIFDDHIIEYTAREFLLNQSLN